VVAVVRRVDENWLEGVHDGRQGLFPAAYSELVQSPLMPPFSTSSQSTASLNASTGNARTALYFQVMEFHHNTSSITRSNSAFLSREVYSFYIVRAFTYLTAVRCFD